eukprot:scaffold240451_cov27-Tisochrysis_lutea.AAC.3
MVHPIGLFAAQSPVTKETCGSSGVALKAWARPKGGRDGRRAGCLQSVSWHSHLAPSKASHRSECTA